MPFADRIEADTLPYAAGAIGLGVASLIARDFTFQWQPVPDGIGAHDMLALVSGALLVVGGLAAVWRNAGVARLILPTFYLLWVVALHVPVVVAKPTVGSLLGVAEILALAAGGAAAIASSPIWPSDLDKSVARRSTLGSVRTRASVLATARLVFGLSALVFGLSHFVYAELTAKMVPGWIPLPLFWAYATGAGHALAGLAILSGIKARLAATLEAAMCGAFVVLLHAPRVIAAPDSRFEWTMLCVALSLAGAALLIRRIVPH